VNFCLRGSCAFLILLLGVRLDGQTSEPGSYAGVASCANCHKEVAAKQGKTAMANTWRGADSHDFPNTFRAQKSEATSNAATYEVKRADGNLQYTTTLPSGDKVSVPVEAVVGGTRHGVSFLAKIDQVQGLKLDRAALAEARYAYNLAHKELVVSPGFALEKPTTYEDALGNILSTTFEKRCLTCHGQPDTLGAGKQGGVHCESCHGPSQTHVESMNHGRAREATAGFKLNTPTQQMETCGQCHTGFTFQSDPLPDDLLVSNQVNALQRSECFIQSPGKLGCTNCHDPHDDTKDVVKTTVATCLGCHSAATPEHAALCPVNNKENCVSCHMPYVRKSSFDLADHWIRVHPEQGVSGGKTDANFRSRIKPAKAYLRIIVVADHEKAAEVTRRLSAGEPFRQVANALSIDPSAGAGGYVGVMELSQLDSRLAEATSKLGYGETSGEVSLGDRYVILNRMPRDFLWEAAQLYDKAVALKDKGDVRGALETGKAALDIYPFFLRAMILMGTTLGEVGDVQKANQILAFAAQSYPKDAIAQFNLALTLANNPTNQIPALRRVLELDPDTLAAYENLGAAQFLGGNRDAAIDTFKQGLLIDPLAAKLNYNLGLALEQLGDRVEANRRKTLASIADPSLNNKK
jgi:tetratricopeptide (TPR) repeat protein